MLTFWLILVLPWVLELFYQSGILATAFGALLWGMCVVVAAVQPNIKNLQLRQRMGYLLDFLSCFWVCYWALSLAGLPRALSLEPKTLQWLTLSHSGLMSAGAGMVLVLWLGATLWLFQDHLLRKNSWERRQHPSRLPSLEALGRICSRTLGLAFSSWFLGLSLAFITANLKWHGADPAAPMASRALAWIRDPQVFASVMLGFLLFVCFQLRLWLSQSARSLYQSYWAFSTLFMVFFVWLMSPGRSSLHEPLKWFLR